MTNLKFNTPLKKLDDVDLPRIAAEIGCGEDELHAVMEVETSNRADDGHGRLPMLFEPHVFYRNLSGAKRDAAVRAGLAYPNWRSGYPADSYPRFLAACDIDETAAIKSASWGFPQILGENFKASGYASPQAMLQAFTEAQANQLQAMVNFIKASGMARALQRHDWAAFASRYNGPKYATHNYHGRLAAAFAKWQKVPDTPWDRNAAVVNIGGNAVDASTSTVRGTITPAEATAPVALPMPATKPTDAKDAKQAGYIAGGVGVLAIAWQTIMGSGMLRAAIILVIVGAFYWFLVRPMLRRMDALQGFFDQVDQVKLSLWNRITVAAKGAKQLLWGRFLALVPAAGALLGYADIIDWSYLYNLLPTFADGLISPAMYGPVIGGGLLAFVNNWLRKVTSTPAGQTDLNLAPEIAPPLVPDEPVAIAEEPAAARPPARSKRQPTGKRRAKARA